MLVNGNRDTEGRSQVLCSFYPGIVVRSLPPDLQVSYAEPSTYIPMDAACRRVSGSDAGADTSTMREPFLVMR